MRVGILRRVPWLFSIMGFSLMTAAFAQESFQKLDVVSGWLIERKIEPNQQLRCRASIPAGGTWFAARIHLDGSGQIVVPQDVPFALVHAKAVDEVRAALDRCRASILYLKE